MINHLSNIINDIKLLYKNGECPFNVDLKYLVDIGLLVDFESKLSISPSWIELSHKLNEDDFIKTVIAANPEITLKLLSQAKKYVNEISTKKDKKEIFSFVDSLSHFAESLLNIDENLVDQEPNASSFPYDNLSYRLILRLLKNIQLIKKTDSNEICLLSDEPDRNWINGRIITTVYPIGLVDPANKFVMTYINIPNESLATDTKSILAQPWETFLIILGMIKVEYRIEDQDGFLIKPVKPAGALEEQDLLVILSSSNGRIKEYGNLKAFTAELCACMGILLFPETEPQIDIALFALLRRNIFSYGGNEYILDPLWEERIYNKERFLKNKSRLLRKNLRSVIDRMRSEI